MFTAATLLIRTLLGTTFDLTFALVPFILDLVVGLEPESTDDDGGLEFATEFRLSIVAPEPHDGGFSPIGVTVAPELPDTSGGLGIVPELFNLDGGGGPLPDDDDGCPEFRGTRGLPEPPDPLLPELFTRG